jgi:hypothetical protein
MKWLNFRFCRYAFGLSACLLVFAGCAGFNLGLRPAPESSQIAKPVEPLPALPTALSAEASEQLKVAEMRVNEARAANALWSQAVQKLALAKKAATIFDSETTKKLADEIIALCERSLAQAKSPPVSW